MLKSEACFKTKKNLFINIIAMYHIQLVIAFYYIVHLSKQMKWYLITMSISKTQNACVLLLC